MSKWVYRYGGGNADGNATMKALLGGKGANLAEMSRIGLPVPPGFTITTEVCNRYLGNDGNYPDGLAGQIRDSVRFVEELTGATFGGSDHPLLLSVRSGARASMPGMMDTVLNLGLNDETAAAMARRTGDQRFAQDSYRRFIQMYGDVVLDVDHYLFEEALDQARRDEGVALDTELSAAELGRLVRTYKGIIEAETGTPFPEKPEDQLWGAVGAVFRSWMNQRAITYRRLHNLPVDWGTAVSVQAMVFGNMGSDCATGVCFTRNPSTGENLFYGEYLINAQGEDVVAGIRTPQPLSKAGGEGGSLEEVMPAAYGELVGVRHRLEAHYRDMQDIEFTIQQGTLYVLQTRNGKRTAAAAVRIAVEMCEEGLISRDDALRQVDANALEQLLHPMLDPEAERRVLARGLPASPGAASGHVVLTSAEAERRAELGERVILVREETSPEDINGMAVSAGILTSRGGMTSHAAVVARGMGRPCVSGASAIRVDHRNDRFFVGDTVFEAGTVITVDGAKGEVLAGEVPTIEPQLTGEFARLMEWADARRRLAVRTNAETPADARAALRFGAEGIGLCRTEHMFFNADRVVSMRRMILAETETDRRAALTELLPMQRQDFAEIFRIMGQRPVTIRLLDPPLHEFLPGTDRELAEIARAAGTSPEHVRRRVLQLRESNPMLGHRGCRLAVTYPEIYEMQAQAIFEAIAEVRAADGLAVEAEIMVPLAFSKAELSLIAASIGRVGTSVERAAGIELPYKIGTMVELPRAALAAAELADVAEFFSFGTNDLTQTTFGISRDDAGTFLPAYEAAGLIERDPFVALDRTGVGELVRIASERGRGRRADISLGICGEHGGEPDSIRFCNEIGLDYVSCSPYRVPIARLAAAQAALDET